MSKDRTRKIHLTARGILGVGLSALLIAAGVFAALLLGSVETHALTEPDGYGLAITDIAAQLTDGGHITGAGTEYSITDAQGFVTIARLSRSFDFAGYTFSLGQRASFTLAARENDLNAFFGIGCEAYPFRGRIEMTSGVTDHTYLKLEGWPTLFNYLSSSAAIVTRGDKYLFSDSSGQFSLAGVLVADSAVLDIGGFRFAAANQSGVLSAGDVGLVAGVIRAGGAGRVSIGLSDAFAPGVTYTVSSTDGNAGGLFGTVESGVEVEITLAAFGAEVTAAKGGAGVLVGKNCGSFSLNGRLDVNAASGAAGAAAGLVGENAGGADLSFGELNIENITVTGQYAGGVVGKNVSGASVSLGGNVSITGISVTGSRAGGMFGVSQGEVIIADGASANVESATVLAANSTADSAEDSAAVIGGVFGETDTAPRGTFSVSNVSLGGATGASIGAMGGFAGSFTAGSASDAEVTVGGVSITSSSFDAALCGTDSAVGGYFGIVTAKVPLTLLSDGISGESRFNNAKSGTLGGVIGRLEGDVTLRGQSGTFNIKNIFDNSGFSGTLGGAVGLVGEGGHLCAAGLSIDNTMSAIGAGMADAVGIVKAGAAVCIDGIAYKNNMASVLISETEQGASLRLSGTVRDNSAKFRHIVQKQDNSLIFADGEGFDFTCAGTAEGCDIGSYGQVIRNDRLGVIQPDPVTHAPSVASPLPLTQNTLTLASTADAARLAITLMSEGRFSGVEGIDSTNYTSLLACTINITADIDLSASGIEQFTRADRQMSFSGELRGNGNTLTLDIGASLGGSVGILTPDNARRYIGAFSGLSGASVSSLSIAGRIDYRANLTESVWIGGLAGYSDGALSISGGTNTVNIALSGGDFRRNNIRLYIGGYFGQARSAALSIEGVNAAAQITQAAASYNYTYDNSPIYIGGVGGEIVASADTTFKNSTIAAQITQSAAVWNAHIGGFAAEFSTNGGYFELDMRGTGANGARISSSTRTDVSGTTAGGLIGRSYKNCRITLDGAWQGSVSDGGRPTLGGLIHTLEGKLTLNSGFSLSGSDFRTNGSLRGCLAANGERAIITVACAPEAFDNVSADGFDLFVGKNITSYATCNVAATGGILTVETAGAETGQIPTDSRWFDLIAAKAQNSQTRYYFNIARLEGREASATVSSPADLIYWNVYDFGASLPAYVKNYSYGRAVLNISGAERDIDMTNYCFYPTAKEGVSFDFDGRTLTLGRADSFGVGGVALPAQLYGLQGGIFSDIITRSEDSVNVNIGNITLRGKAYESGALICGRLEGRREQNVRAEAKINLHDIFFDGLTLASANGALMINSIGSNVTGTISSVSHYTRATYRQAAKQNTYAEGTRAASALILRGGVENGTESSENISISFSDIVLEGEKSGTIFANATLFYVINYSGNNTPFTYNFDLADDWSGTAHVRAVTYGCELYTNDKQQQYYDKAMFVRPDTVPTATGTLYDGFASEYIVYVCINPELLGVNRKIIEFDGGWGTYDHPYLISTATQLETLANIIAGASYSFQNGWTVNYPNAGDYAAYEQYVGNGTNLVSSTGESLGAATLVSYLRGAYYKITSDITLTDAFSGLGSLNYPFHGVIVGGTDTAKVRIVLSARSGTIGSVGYGFILAANGCAVSGLELVYEGDIVLDMPQLTSATSSPAADTAGTATPHFGGVIAWVIGGDNRIDNVSVTVNAKAPDSVSARTSAFGGYVGLISGGGVILSRLDAAQGVTIPASLSDCFYFNPYIGKVLHGYAFSTDAAYDNTDKNYTIPHVGLDGSETLYDTLCAASGDNFTLNNSRDVLMLSFAMRGGAFAYKDTAIGYGRSGAALSRRGDYSAVGTLSGTADSRIPSGERGNTNGRHRDDESAESRSNLFNDYFGVKDKNYLSNTENTINSITFAASEYDMTAYGNAFCGFGSPFGVKMYFRFRTVTAAAPGTLIKLNIDVKQYYSGTAIEPDGAPNLAFLTESGIYGGNDDIYFSNITLSGRVSLGLYDKNGKPATAANWDKNNFCVGGFVGYSQNAGFKDVGLVDLEIISPVWGGGLAANPDYFKSMTAVEGCTVRNLRITSLMKSGGLFGYYRFSQKSNLNVVISGVSMEDSVITVESSGGNALYCGAFVADCGNNSGSGTLTIRDSGIKTSKIVSAGRKDSGTVYAGGFVGYANRALKLENCTIDGCAVLSGFTDVVNASDPIAKLIENANTDFSSGNAGGFVGFTSAALSVSDCRMVSGAAETVILGCRDAAGVLGAGNINGAAMTADGVTLSASAHPLYIMGRLSVAGISSWNTEPATYSLKNINISGFGGNTLFVLGVGKSSSAGGIFGSIGAGTKTVSALVSNAEISSCVIAGAGASGVICTIDGSSALTLENVKLIKNSILGGGNAAGVVNTLKNAKNSLTLDGLYLSDNVIRNTGRANLGFIAGTLRGTFDGYYVLMGNNDVGYCADAADYYELTRGTLTVPALTSRDKIGLVAYQSSASARIFAMSVEPGEYDLPASHIGNGTDNCTVLYAAYGAPSRFKATYPSNPAFTPRAAIEAVGTEAAQKYGSLTLHSDPVTKQGGQFTPNALNLLSWWQWKYAAGEPNIKSLSEVEKLGELISMTENAGLPTLHLQGKTHDVISELLELITGGGYGQLDTAFPEGGISAAANRYNIASDGTLEWVSEPASVKYENGRFVSDKYDIISEDSKTVTVLTVTFRADDTHSYTVDIVIYNPQILNIKTTISAMEGEVYKLSSYFGPWSKIDISSGSKFSLYIEYAYNETVKNIDNFNFAKQIFSSTNESGSQTAYTEFAAGTSLILIDLNSKSPSGFRYYYLRLDENSAVIDFAEFRDYAGTSGFVPTELSTIVGNGLPDTFAETGDEFELSAVERYLLVIIPPSAGDTCQYNLRAQVKPNDKNIVVRSEENICSVSVWKSDAGNVSLSGQDTPFSNKQGGTLSIDVMAGRSFDEGYYVAMQKRQLYGTHVFGLYDNDNNAVSLPSGTVVNIVDGDGRILQSTRIQTPSAGVMYRVGDIIQHVRRDSTAGYVYSDSFSIIFDFSSVTTADFNAAFASEVREYSLRDSFYLSGDSEHYTGGTKCEGSVKCYTEDLTPVKLAVVPQDRKRLGINLGDRTDETNDGKIDFELVADFSAITDATVESAEVTFSLEKKRCDSTHAYEVMADYSSFAVVSKTGSASITGDTLSVTDGKTSRKYRLTVNLPTDVTLDSDILTNYRLVATIRATDSNGKTHTAEDHFVFLLCKLDNFSD